MNKTTTPQKPTHLTNYENNPFYIATKGIDLLFKYAQSVGILIGVFLVLNLLSNYSGVFNPVPPAADPSINNPSSAEADSFMTFLQQTPAETFLLAGIVILLVVLLIIGVAIYFAAVLDYTASKIAKQQPVTIGNAMSGAFKHFWGFAWVQLIVGVKIFLWSLLFIIPGIIMAVRYSLAGVSYFDKNFRGNAAVKNSLALTKGAWLTTMASQTLMHYVTLGMAGELFTPGARAVLYSQLDTVTAAGEAKPKAHIVSWITLIIPVIFVVLVVLILTLVLPNYNAVGPSILD